MWRSCGRIGAQSVSPWGGWFLMEDVQQTLAHTTQDKHNGACLLADPGLQTVSWRQETTPSPGVERESHVHFCAGLPHEEETRGGEEDGMPLALGPHWSVRLIVLGHGTTACRPPGQEAMHGCTHSTAGAPVSPPRASMHGGQIPQLYKRTTNLCSS